MLVQAAANRWQVAPASCRAAGGYVLHDASGRKENYGALAEDAAKLDAPKELKLKDPKDFQMIGKLTKKLHAKEKVCGQQKYSIDLKRPGMLVASIQRSPVINGRVISFDAKAALAIPGVRQVLKVPAAPASVLGGNQEGVAVLADDYWTAKQGRAALKITWDKGKFAHFNSADLAQQQAAYLSQPDIQIVPTIRTGNVDDALKNAAKVLSAEYTMPYKVASPLEPQCVVVEVKNGKVTFWGGLQVPSYALEAAKVLVGASADQVQLNEILSGGSFGARESKYWLYEAVYLAKISGIPIKLLNSREDEIQALFYHPASYHKLTGGLDAQGNLSALQLRTVVPASPEEWEPGYDERKDKMDYSTTEAISKGDFSYRPQHLDLAWVRHETGVPTG
ncbi:MAG: molybdopterin-dependent oxidoreductase, partial [Glaciimonas sp.]|nr:molybdopterin-dependent oxidoreductase [Glaciimonas sp.]